MAIKHGLYKYVYIYEIFIYTEMIFEGCKIDVLKFVFKQTIFLTASSAVIILQYEIKIKLSETTKEHNMSYSIIFCVHNCTNTTLENVKVN